jgi:hypothetical protein
MQQSSSWEADSRSITQETARPLRNPKVKLPFWWYFLGLRRRVDWLVEASVSEKRAVSIFRDEYGEHNQIRHRRENLKYYNYHDHTLGRKQSASCTIFIQTTFLPRFLKIHFNIIFAVPCKSSVWFPPFGLYSQKCASLSHIRMRTTCPPISSFLISYF